MKFLCEQCHKAMKYLENVELQGEPLMALFECPGCGWRIRFVTNPGEDQFVRSMGIRIGRNEGTVQPLETLRSHLRGEKSGSMRAEENEIAWTEEAEARLNLAPEFIRDVARKATESFARQNGYDRITLEVIEAAHASLRKGLDR